VLDDRTAARSLALSTGKETRPMRRAALLVLILAPAMASGCSSRGYFADRSNDAKDIFTVTVGVGGGAKARVGPVHTGVIMSFGSAGLRNGHFGQSIGEDNFDVELLVVPVEEESGKWYFSQEGVNFGDERGKDYSRATSRVPFVTTGIDSGVTPHYWSQIEVAGGLGLTVRLGFNPGELLDFLLGWFGIDIYGDDIGATKERDRTQKPREKPPEAPSSPEAPPTPPPRR
jgi:hypothetical protein